MGGDMEHAERQQENQKENQPMFLFIQLLNRTQH